MEATFYDLGRYFCSSESGADDYLCDVLPGGGCDCPRYRIYVEGMGTETTCKHLERAKQQWRADFSPTEREMIERSQKLKRGSFQPE